MVYVQVIQCIVYMFEDFNLLKHLMISEEHFRAFVLELRARHSALNA